MKPSRILLAIAAGITAATAAPAAAQAAPEAIVTVPFAADSGDNCRYGSTDGTLGWRIASTTPARAVAVDVRGRVKDRPLPADPGSICPSDGRYSVATFTAYNGSTAIGQQSRRADNNTVTFEFTLGGNSTTARVDRVVVQVCRHSSFTTPPSYCGRAVEYRAPITTQP